MIARDPGFNEQPRPAAFAFRTWRRPRPEPPREKRFAELAGRPAWCSLPEDVRRRFERTLPTNGCATYAGEVVECRISLLGRVLARLACLIGAPLPLSRDTGVAASVTVSEDAARRGQYWVRQYARGRGFPQVIHSLKRFAGPTGLEEYLGRGFGIALTLVVEKGSLYFLSDHYFLALGRVRLRLPRWFSPGRMRVGHIDCGGGRFAFTLDLRHPIFGELVHQVALFADCESAS